ncbi:hypothetical protein DL93DRAFT_2085683 [Clavulina sp. PMI_390]|nr:hypothetical protein DL93DRAFT_2085683 [Clavulina sp. PMI_390]
MAGEISRIAKRLLHRCRHIQFDDDFIQVSRIFELSSPLPKLHSIFASVHRTADFCRTNDFDLTLAPQLRDLRLYTVDWIPPLREGPIILKFGTDLQLKRVDLGGDNIDYNSINLMLAACPHLEELQWEDFTVQETGRNPSPLPPMESLRHVILWGALPISIVGSLNALQLVRLELHYPDDIWGHQPFPLSDPSQLPMLRALILEGDRVATHSQEAKIAKFVEKHPHLEIVGLTMYLTEVMAQTLASIPTLRHARVLRHVGDDNGARLLVRTWAERDPKDARPASPSDSHPLLYMVREIMGNNADNSDENDGSFDAFFSFQDWKFTSWSNADWDLFFSPH